jgi:putative restriction endonuclease
VPEVHNYLALTAADARTQWHSIQARSFVEGRRQADFTPVETLMCLAAMYLVDHRRYGGSTSHRAEEPVPTLATLFRRSNASVLAKMANLDGSRRNGGRHEVEIAARLLATPGQLAALYRLILAAARDAGILAATLPDFLDLDNADIDLEYLGQDELEQRDVEAAVQADSANWASRRADLDERITEQLLVAVARIGQHRFARDVLRNHGHHCVFCGLSVSSKDQRARRMLVASHIKPWRTSTSSERLDVRNGLAACPTHDVAFDTGLLTVNGGLRIHVAPHLHAAVREDPAVRAAFGRPPLAESLLLPAGAAPPGTKYLAWHHDYIGWYRDVRAATPIA